MRTELSDGNIMLRRYRPADIPLLYEAGRESINEMYPWMPWCHAGYSIEESTQWVLSRDEAWEKGSEYSFVIEDTASGAFIGGGGLNSINQLNRFANLGYWVRTGWTRRGVATAATHLIAHAGFEDLGLYRIEILAAVGNIASQRVAEKVGAVKEGILRKRIALYGVPHDAVLYSLVIEDMNNRSLIIEG